MTHTVRDSRNSSAAGAHSLPSLPPPEHAGLRAVERFARQQYALAGHSLEWTLAQLRLARACTPLTAIAAGIELARACRDQLLDAAPQGFARQAAVRAAVERAPSAPRPVATRAPVAAVRARARPRPGTASRAAAPRTATRKRRTRD